MRGPGCRRCCPVMPQAGSLFSYDDAGRLTRTHANPGPQKLRVPAGESLSGLFFVVVTLGETSGRCFAVETRQVVAGFVHHLHDLVETDHMRTVGERGVGVGVEGSGAAAIALRSMQGTCTSPQTGSQVNPRWCSSPISAAYSICAGVPPNNWQAAAAAMAQATPTSP